MCVLGVIALLGAICIFFVCLSLRDLGLRIKLADEAARKTVMQADLGALLTACETMYKEHPTEAHFASQELIDKFGMHGGDELIGTNIPVALRRLSPYEISTSPDHISIRLQPLSRAALLYYVDQTEQLRATRLTNGLWYFNGEQDRRQDLKGQPTAAAAASRGP